MALLAISRFWSPNPSDFHFWHIGPSIRGLHAVLPYGTNTPLFSGLRYTVRYTGTLTPIWDLQMGPRTPKMTHFGPILDPFWTHFGTPPRPLFGTRGRYGPSQGAATKASPGPPDTMGLRASGTDPKRGRFWGLWLSRPPKTAILGFKPTENAESANIPKWI